MWETSAVLGRTGRRVFRLGLSASYRPGEAAVRAGLDAGMNYLFWYWWDNQMTRVLREVLIAPGIRAAVSSQMQGEQQSEHAWLHHQPQMPRCAPFPACSTMGSHPLLTLRPRGRARRDGR